MEPENSISVERIRDILECPVCLESPSCTPIYQCDNGHIVCKSCREKMSNCSLCQVELRDQRCRVAEEILSDTLKNVSTFSMKYFLIIRDFVKINLSQIEKTN